MNNFNRLHPAVQHHVVNSLGWRELRPFQDAVIPPILAGEHLIVRAPTAGGKTEAAFLPTVSRMLAEGWTGLSVLYICPIKALLNNLDLRLQRYCKLFGRQSALWHGDVKASARKRILRDLPDCLLTTPESLEVMLVSQTVDTRRMFGDLRVVVVDEVHAFAGDDRGWHLLSLLQRIGRVAGRELQRIGLSATVGNPEALVDWLAASSTNKRGISDHARGQMADADVKLDFVGSLQNAAVVISRLHRGEKRLVFVDSRARAEQLSSELRQLQVATFVTHSSLSQEQRHWAEHAFTERDDCVIVATSVLELGIDVGDLDRVIQIDAPPTVSSFLQRMGRTGRRRGTTRNCLFLATKDGPLIQAAGLISLWATGFIESIEPPPKPYHILAQQLMALVLQEDGLGRRDWFPWIAGVPAFAEMSPETVEKIVDWMLEREILWSDQGILGMGREGEETYGRRHFMELFSVFTSPPLFSVLHGRRELGYVDEMTFLAKQEGPRILLLGGQSWVVNHIDWQRRQTYVEASDIEGRSRWKGEGQGLNYDLCQAIKQVLAADDASLHWSRRATDRIEQIRHEFAWLDTETTVVLMGSKGRPEWWTFGGLRANATLAHTVSESVMSRVEHDSFTLTFEDHVRLDEIQSAVGTASAQDVSALRPEIDEAAVDGLKFSACLPRDVAVELLEERLSETHATVQTLNHRVKIASC